MSGMGWCPACREWTVVDAGEPCAWCSTTVVRRRGGWKRPDRTGRINEASARAIHVKYQTGVSARTLGRELYRVLGYKTPQTCERAIGAAFRRYGLPRRERIAATVLAATKNGLSPRDHRVRYARRRAAGFTNKMKERRPRCAGTKLQAPGKGRRCVAPAQHGSAFCFAHDPERRTEVERIAQHMRERQPRHETVVFAQVLARLDPWLANEKHPATALARATGVPHGTCSRLLKHRPATVTVSLAARLLAPLTDLQVAA